MKTKDEKNKWNEIAKSLYINSNKKYFRTPKQCREQFLNHLDPTKIRSEWTSLEDYELIVCVMRVGKKWSKIAKELGNRRTEHMVKNRYRSIVNNELKKLFHAESEELTLSKIKQRLESTQSIKRHLQKEEPTCELKNIKSVSFVNVEEELSYSSSSFSGLISGVSEFAANEVVPSNKESTLSKDFHTDITINECLSEKNEEVSEESKNFEDSFNKENSFWLFQSESDFEDIHFRDFMNSNQEIFENYQQENENVEYNLNSYEGEQMEEMNFLEPFEKIN